MAWSRAWLYSIGMMAVAHSASAQLVQNGNFNSTTLPNSSLIGVDGGTVADWNANGGYNFLFTPGSADTTGANQGNGYTPNCYYNTGCGQNLYLWGPGSGSSNGLPATSPGGGNFVALDGDYGTEPFQQTITGLHAGTVYAVSFYYGFAQQAGYTGPTIQNLTASLGAASQSVGAYDLGSKGFSGWDYETFYFEAESTSAVLGFLAYGNVQLPPFALLSDVSMVAAPEPATWAMMGVGFASLIGAARLRRARGGVARA